MLYFNVFIVKYMTNDNNKPHISITINILEMYKIKWHTVIHLFIKNKEILNFNRLRVSISPDLARNKVK